MIKQLLVKFVQLVDRKIEENKPLRQMYSLSLDEQNRSYFFERNIFGEITLTVFDRKYKRGDYIVFGHRRAHQIIDIERYTNGCMQLLLAEAESLVSL